MTDILAQTIFGWPAIILSILLALAAITRRWAGLLIVATIVALPFFWYLSQTPRFGLDALLIPLLLLAAAYALTQNRARIAALLLIPYAAFILWIAIRVLM